jgi:hypothetical protein
MSRKITILTLIVCALLPPITYAAAPPATGTNWLQQVTTEVDTLTTTHGDALVDMGVTELNFIALMSLIAMVVRWNLAHMVIGYASEFHPRRSFRFLFQTVRVLVNAPLLLQSVPRNSDQLAQSLCKHRPGYCLNARPGCDE